jgi:aryl-alcohol dehydrogenase-like predicted oxidoreductase
MKTVHPGNGDIIPSSIGFGCARLGGVFQDATTKSMISALHAAFDGGITFYDTADIYCHGESEKLIGRAFRGRRDQVIIAGKAGYCLPAQRRLVARVKPLAKPIVKRFGLTRAHVPAGVRGALTQNFAPDYLVRACEQSLSRLGTDYLDLFQLHSPPADVLERGDFLEPLERLKRQGKIRAYGVSCEHMADAQICFRYPGVAALQLRLSLLDRSPYDEILAQAQANGVAVIARECFAGGLLTRPLDALGLETLIPNPVERSTLEACWACAPRHTLRTTLR